ncbi:unnamed protein product [Calypogeia fissa]
MASCCIQSFVLSKPFPRTSHASREIEITSRSRTPNLITIAATSKEKKLQAQLGDQHWNNCRPHRSITIAATAEKKLRAQPDDHHSNWRSTYRNTIIPTKTDDGSKKLRAQVEDWKTSGSSSDVMNAQLVRDDLLGLIAGEERGLKTQKNAQKRDEIIKTIDALALLGADIVTTDESLSAAWRMLWTTEKEQLFIVEKAHLFGTEAGDILQIIDVGSRTLNNVITFPPTGIFLVNSTIDVESAQRVNFKFTRASLRVGGWRIPFPPFGQGWFESVYLDDKIRVARDIRGDYLVVDRALAVPDLS